ncbi:MAG: RDD family protein [Acidimicrobiales bacterium]
MTDSSSSQPPGWYYAQGDPVGTQRYWDGTQWVGGPQAVAGAVAQGGYGGASMGGGTPANYGSRVVAYLIDIAVVIGGLIVIAIVTAIFGAISDTLAAIVGLLGYLALIGVSIWNLIIRQGQTGQSIGKSQQNIKLIADATHQPVGAGMAFVRYLLGGLINIACYIDLLWPLWDQDKKRLSDKILNFSVVQA